MQQISNLWIAGSSPAGRANLLYNFIFKVGHKLLQSFGIYYNLLILPDF